MFKANDELPAERLQYKLRVLILTSQAKPNLSSKSEKEMKHTTSLFSENSPSSAKPSSAVHLTSNLDRIPLSFKFVVFTSLAKLKSVILILKSSLTLEENTFR